MRYLLIVFALLGLSILVSETSFACEPGEKYCVGGDMLRCEWDGKGWTTIPFGCRGGDTVPSELNPAVVVGSEIKSSNEKTCVDGNEMVEKSLVVKTKGKEEKETVSKRWFESTGKDCDAKRGGGMKSFVIPEASTDLQKELQADSAKRPKKGEEAKQRGSWCSDGCYYTAGQYECWSGDLYWIDYCFNECGDLTGDYFYEWDGYCG